MANAYQQAIAAAQVAQNAFAGEMVEYRRGNASAVLTAINSPKDYPLASGIDAVQNVQVDDWLVIVADLCLAQGGQPAAPTKPIRGDQIRRTVGSVVQVYEVQPLGSKDVCEMSGPLRYRIHTKLIGTEPAQ